MNQELGTRTKAHRNVAQHIAKHINLYMHNDATKRLRERGIHTQGNR